MPDLTSEGRPFNERSLLPRGLPGVLPANIRHSPATLFNIATLLRDRQDNPFQIRAYENGARALMGRCSDLAAALRQQDTLLPHRKGLLGERLQRKLQELARTGEMAYFQEMLADLPPYMAALMSVPGVGPRTVQRLHECLGIETPADLVAAARSGRLRSLQGFDPKRTEQLGLLSLLDEPHTRN